MKKNVKNILILNGSSSGANGNCNELIKSVLHRAQALDLPIRLNFEVIHLAQSGRVSIVKRQIKKADAFIFVTGTYWDSWGSPLQKFLEDVTDLEGTSAFLGKPSFVFVLNHSVGGKGLLSRLQGVLSTLGCLVPPMSGWVYSLVTHLALNSNRKSKHVDDFWSPSDLDIILQNLSLSLSIDLKWASWPIDRKNFKAQWFVDK